jgi:histidinol-phosphate aminotransferase
MFELNDYIVRKNILALKPYSSARDEFSGDEGVFLDANENPFGELNRYPDPHQKELKEKLSKIKSVPSENIFIGNGSDEVIDLTFRIFCNPGKDKALTFSPGYGMYEVSAKINDVELIKVSLNQSFQIDFDIVENYLNDKALKLIFVCSPNNPTGNIINNIELLLQKFNGIVVVDEAYIDFSDTDSFIAKINEYPNLIVAQTFSKAWGLAECLRNNQIRELSNSCNKGRCFTKINICFIYHYNPFKILQQ